MIAARQFWKFVQKRINGSHQAIYTLYNVAHGQLPHKGCIIYAFCAAAVPTIEPRDRPSSRVSNPSASERKSPRVVHMELPLKDGLRGTMITSSIQPLSQGLAVFITCLANNPNNNHACTASETENSGSNQNKKVKHRVAYLPL